jgi:hypothetical protein
VNKNIEVLWLTTQSSLRQYLKPQTKLMLTTLSFSIVRV